MDLVDIPLYYNGSKIGIVTIYSKMGTPISGNITYLEMEKIVQEVPYMDDLK